MADKNHTSSMTSVTSEDTSADSESDTTESYSNYVSSSPISTTDYNTDDKLTPGLNNIQISNLNNSSLQAATGKSYSEAIQRKSGKPKKADSVDITPGTFSFGLFQQPHPVRTQAKKKRGKNNISLLKRSFGHNKFIQSTEDNLGVTDPENKLSTDFSDTSSKFDETLIIDQFGSQSLDNEDEDNSDFQENGSAELGESSRPYFPDYSSHTWYQAQCFDSYWSTYSFVMEWYRQHTQAVHMLSGDGIDTSSQRLKKTQRKRKSRKRSRNRKRGKSNESRGTQGPQEPKSQIQADDSDEMEMTITDDMMTFFAHSFKHRMERDNEKTKENSSSSLMERIDVEQASNQAHLPSKSAPKEQPGVRRTSEMRSLYGAGAPMVHGMETALQMTFDRITDRHQPKLWPNMPLHLVFK